MAEQMAEHLGTAGTERRRKVHPGEALGIIPTPTPHPKKDTLRYNKGDLDLDSIVAFLTHLRKSNDMPKEALRVRGRLRNAFPGHGVTKPSIRAAYAKMGWDINKVDFTTKKQKRAARLREQLARKNLTKCSLRP